MTDDPLFLFINFTDKTVAGDDNGYNEAIRNGRWQEVISSDTASRFVEKNSNEGPVVAGNEKELLQTAVACLYAFVQSNFTGPKLEFDLQTLFTRNGTQTLDPRRELFTDGEDLNVNTIYPELLVIARKVLNHFEETPENKLRLKWWKMRLTCIHQQVMDELCNTLYTNFKECAEWLQEHITDLKDKELETLMMVEISVGYLLFHRVQKCEYWLERLFKGLDIELKVEGLLGVRTKFQQKALPQLCLRVERLAETDLLPSVETNGTTQLPKLLRLDDDVRLERIKFSDPKDNEIITTPSVIQCLLLTKLKHILKSQPKDLLSDEEVEPYITTLLHQTHGPLPVRLATLLQNIHQESNSSRTVERSLKQCEEAIALLNDSKHVVSERLSYFFASMLPPMWTMKKQLAELMLSLGMVKTALDSYIAIQSWEDVIFCYNRLELRHKAAEIIQQELDKQPTAPLYCLLGDATDEVKCYEKAWKFSGLTSSRAQRHWGNFYYFKQNYEAAIPHLQKSVEINPLQETTLLRLGYAAIKLEKWDLAAQSYLRYTHLEQRGFESWNNLAKALIKLGDKNRAHKILNEALKCNYSNWKVWENFLMVSVDTGHFEDAINAYQRLIDLKEKYLDVEVLQILVKAVVDDLPDAQGRPSLRLKKKLNNLVAHQCVQYGSEDRVWEFASLLAENELSRAQKLQKAYSTFSQSHQSWSNSRDTLLRAVDLCRGICQSSLSAIGDETISNMERSAALSQLSSARLSTRACIKVAENSGPDIIKDWELCEEKLKELKSLLEVVQAKASSLSK